MKIEFKNGILNEKQRIYNESLKDKETRLNEIKDANFIDKIKYTNRDTLLFIAITLVFLISIIMSKIFTVYSDVESVSSWNMMSNFLYFGIGFGALMSIIDAKGAIKDYNKVFLNYEEAYLKQKEMDITTFNNYIDETATLDEIDNKADISLYIIDKLHELQTLKVLNITETQFNIYIEYAEPDGEVKECRIPMDEPTYLEYAYKEMINIKEPNISIEDGKVTIVNTYYDIEEDI